MTLAERLGWWEQREVLELESYRSVEEYDPVLRGHCRLEEEKAKGPQMNTDERG